MGSCINLAFRRKEFYAICFRNHNPNLDSHYLDFSRRDAIERALGGSSSEDSVLSTLAEAPSCSLEVPASLSRPAAYGFYNKEEKLSGAWITLTNQRVRGLRCGDHKVIFS